jgi:3-phenylpropionate/trans-cinnamate dioxygenase ferredoxin reductase subunit
VKTVTVVGASLAGLRSAQALREHGFDGRIVVVGDEARSPYDRPPLSKAFLAGDVTEQEIALATQQDLEILDAEWFLGCSAIRLRPGCGEVELSDGRAVRTDGVVVATGARPLDLPGGGDLDGVFTLRTLEDAVGLRAALGTGSPRVVVVGASFIGSEVASTCRGLGLQVTVVEAMDIPLAPALGPELAQECTTLHQENGVVLLTGRTVRQLLAADGRVRGVQLADGRQLDADVVVVGIGVRPNTEWLAGSGLTLDNGVVCDQGGVSAIPEVVAVGDVARCWSPALDAATRIEHWTNAMQQPRVATENLLAGRTIRPLADVPYFWSEQYGVRIQFAGHRLPGAVPRVVDGDLAERRWTAAYEVGGTPVAVLAMNQPRTFTRLRRTLADRMRVSPTMS